MPLYEYKCDSCGELFEAIQKFSDEPLKVHEKCGGGPVHRLLSAPSFQFKGSGWYVTDYGKGGKIPTAANGDKGGSGSKESSTDGAKDGSKDSSKETTSKSESTASATPAPSTSSSEKS